MYTQKSFTFKKKDPKIFDSNVPTNTGVLYWQQKTLEEITKLSGPLAASNEFQIHYWALVVRMRFTDNSLIDIALPTTIFNYAQEVTSAHIDFELKDVSKVSDALKPVHNSVTNKLLPILKETFVNSEHYTIEYLSVPLNTMHRHPTGVVSFSGTDLKKDHEVDTGIVFPLKTGDETPSFSSIIYNNPVKLVHTEYRIATGDVTTKEGIHYEKGRCGTFVKGSIVQPSMAERFLGQKPTNTSYFVDRTNIADMQGLLDVLDDIEYEPNTQFIKADNVKKKTYTVSKTVVTSNKNKTTSKKEPAKTTKEKEIPLAYDQETRDLVKQITNCTINSLNVLSSMTLPQLRYSLMPLEKYYYQDAEDITVTDYVQLTKQELIDQIIEVQNDIIDEIDSMMSGNTNYETKEDIEPSVDYMKTYLSNCGAPEDDLNNAGDETIRRWYKELAAFDIHEEYC